MNNTQVRSVAAGAYEALMLDTGLSPAAHIDFCIKTDDHWRALQAAVRNGATAQDLDTAIGEFGQGSVAGRMANLVLSFAPQWSHLKWESAWDAIAAEEDIAEEED